MFPGKEDIFHLQLTDDGIKRITRFCNIAKWVMIFSFFASLPGIINPVIEIIGYRGVGRTPLEKFFFRVSPYFWITYIILWQLQVFYYWKFARHLKKAVTGLQQKLFNDSFTYLINNAWLMIAVILLSVFNNGFILYIALAYLR